MTLDGADPRLLQKDISMFDSDEDMASDGGEWEGEGEGEGEEGMGGVIGGSNVVRVMPQRAARQSPDFSTIEGSMFITLALNKRPGILSYCGGTLLL